jgi:hypothetical protein
MRQASNNFFFLILYPKNDSAKQKRMNVTEITCSASNLDEEDED